MSELLADVSKMDLSWDIDYLPEVQIVRATTHGVVTRDGALRVAADLAARLTQTKALKFLVDHRAAVVQIDIVSLYYLLFETERQGLTRNFSGAIVFARDTDHDFRFYQARALNEGFNRRMFVDMDRALQWLASLPG